MILASFPVLTSFLLPLCQSLRLAVYMYCSFPATLTAFVGLSCKLSATVHHWPITTKRVFPYFMNLMGLLTSRVSVRFWLGAASLLQVPGLCDESLPTIWYHMVPFWKLLKSSHLSLFFLLIWRGTILNLFCYSCHLCCICAYKKLLPPFQPSFISWWFWK